MKDNIIMIKLTDEEYAALRERVNSGTSTYWERVIFMNCRHVPDYDQDRPLKEWF